MSHVRTDATRIKNPNEVLLREVVQRIAGTESGGQVLAAADDYYSGEGNGKVKSDINLALRTSVLRRGLAINAKGGLGFVGDGYGYENAYVGMQRRITNDYLKVEVRRALEEAQFTVSNEVAGPANTVRLEAVNGTGTKKVVIDITSDGKMKWEFEGFPGDECFDMQTLIDGILKARGIETTEESVTRKDSEHWLEERLPGRNRETEN